MVNFFFTKYMANDGFSEPPRHADSKIPVFAKFWVRVTSGPGGSVSVGMGGGRSIEPLGGGLARGLYRPPPIPAGGGAPLPLGPPPSLPWTPSPCPLHSNSPENQGFGNVFSFGPMFPPFFGHSTVSFLPSVADTMS